MSQTALAPFQEELPAGPGWLEPVRRSALQRFHRQGLPTTREEDWRYTSLSSLSDLPLAWIPPAELPESDRPLARASLLDGLDTLRLVFVDGVFRPSLSDPLEAGEGIRLRSLDGCLEDPPDILRRSLEPKEAGSQCSLADLNAAWFAGGLVLQLAAHAAAPRPVHLIHYSTGEAEGGAACLRTLVEACEGSRAVLIEEYLGPGRESPGLTSGVTWLEIAPSARIEHIKIQNDPPGRHHLARIEARLGERCSFHCHSFALGARLSRNDIRVRMEGPGLECVLNGLYLTRDRQLADHHMVVDHAAPDCRSHEYFNGILDGRSRGVFHGRILVRQGAQRTDAKQTSRNLLLSEEARVNTKPQLEIYADDVRCTHGATVGQLDPEAVFYLMARGLLRPQAMQLLQLAFAEEIVDRIGHEAVRQRLYQVIEDRL